MTNLLTLCWGQKALLRALHSYTTPKIANYSHPSDPSKSLLSQFSMSEPHRRPSLASLPKEILLDSQNPLCSSTSKGHQTSQQTALRRSRGLRVFGVHQEPLYDAAHVLSHLLRLGETNKITDGALSAPKPFQELGEQEFWSNCKQGRLELRNVVEVGLHAHRKHAEHFTANIVERSWTPTVNDIERLRLGVYCSTQYCWRWRREKFPWDYFFLLMGVRGRYLSLLIPEG